MRLMIIGSGAREHALAWKLSRSILKPDIFCIPGNAGIARIAQCSPASLDDLDRLLRLTQTMMPDLVIVGPEAPLAAGIVDRFHDRNIAVFGPIQAAAQLESSKVFCKKFLQDLNIPTALFDICSVEKSARAAAKKRDGRCAIKADGLAAGKGVIVCRNMIEANEAIDRMLVNNEFGDASKEVIVEDLLVGEEASIMAICDGCSAILLESSQDHKAIGEGDAGPNTGGMGAYSPAPVVTPALRDLIELTIIRPTLQGLNRCGIPFIGILYAGVMLVDGVPFVLEFNVRFGDPETQTVLFRMKSDLIPILQAAVSGKLNEIRIEWRKEPAICVTLASQGYPGAYQKGVCIHGLDSVEGIPDTVVFHAGTRIKDSEIVTNGGRVLSVAALGFDLREAQQNAYRVIDKIHFEGMYYRRDIGWRALNR